ncbi:hypothetical protein GCK32_002141 [Trichostrongylus colubriformis]|uniref:K Homology domain-containing protein n=1 Tax=Trichostrongylus colubriformis TaxID=6319 RepID=A0AAN8IKD2_TRICO
MAKSPFELAYEAEDDARTLESFESPATKRKRVDDVDNLSVRLLLSPQEVGALLGPQGERIKTVKREHKCFVKINDETCPGSSDRICIVRGDVPNVISGVGALIRSIAEYRSGESGNMMLLDVLRKRTGDWPTGMNHAATILKADKRTNTCLEIGVPIKHIGAVIGRKGHVVRDIECYSACKVQLSGKEATADGKRLIRIIGTEENLDFVKMMVERVVNEDYISNLPSALHDK